MNGRAMRASLSRVAFLLLATSTASCGVVNQLLRRSVQAERMPAEQVVAAVDAFDPAELETGLEALNRAALLGEAGSVEALEPWLHEDDEITRWAAVYVAGLLAEGQTDAAVLAPVLDDTDAHIRVMAAGSLIGLGDRNAIPILIEALARQDPLPYNDLPLSTGEFALDTLSAFTGKNFATQDEWRAWWDSAADRLHWDGAMYVEE